MIYLGILSVSSAFLLSRWYRDGLSLAADTTSISLAISGRFLPGTVDIKAVILEVCVNAVANAVRACNGPFRLIHGQLIGKI